VHVGRVQVPIQIGFSGLTQKIVPERRPGLVGNCACSNSIRVLFSASTALTPTLTGAFARLRTATAKRAFVLPALRSGRISLSISWYGAMTSVASACAICTLWAREYAVTAIGHGLASDSGARGGWKRISTSCSKPSSLVPYGTRYTVGGYTVHQ
jgi:hypothetical protein